MAIFVLFSLPSALNLSVPANSKLCPMFAHSISHGHITTIKLVWWLMLHHWLLLRCLHYLLSHHWMSHHGLLHHVYLLVLRLLVLGSRITATAVAGELPRAKNLVAVLVVASPPVLLKGVNAAWESPGPPCKVSVSFGGWGLQSGVCPVKHGRIVLYMPWRHLPIMCVRVTLGLHFGTGVLHLWLLWSSWTWHRAWCSTRCPCR